MLELIHKLLGTDPVTLALCIAFLSISIPVFVPILQSRRTSNIREDIVSVRSLLSKHLEETKPIIEEHNKLKTEMAAIKSMPEDVKRIMLAVAKIAAKLDIDVDL